LLQLLDVHVLERHDPYILDKSRWAGHIPHPRVVHLDLEVDLAVDVAHVQVDLVREVEAALSLDHVGELPDDVAVLPVELQLHLGLVLFEIFGAHPVPPSSIAASASATESMSPERATAATLTVPRRRPRAEPTTTSGAAAATFAYEYRCSTHGP